jgi:serine/threonine protein kinase
MSVPSLGEGSVVGGIYRIRKILGQGGMGRIFEADDILLNRRVALKVPLDSRSARVVMAEGQALAALRHPHLPVVHTAGRHQGIDFLVMELLHGVTLERHVERSYEAGRPLALGEAVGLLADICDALHTIHQAGIVHRDIKPDNVLLCGKRGPVLIDFGLVVPEVDVSPDILYAGTPYYVAPEMIGGDATRGSGHLADLYSFGVMGYEILTGRVPYNGNDLETILRLHREAPIPDVRMLRPDLPAALARTIKELMSKQPGERPQTAEDVLWSLRKVALQVENRERPACPRVVVVSEDLELVGKLRHLLNSWCNQFELDVNASGQQALEAIIRQRPNLLLLDLHLGDMSGIEMLMQLRGMDAELPDAVVAISDQAQPQDLELLRHLDVMSFVSKGAHMANMLEPVVRNVLLDT